MTALGSNVHIFARPHQREPLRWCFETVLSCPVATVGHPAMPEPMLMVKFWQAAAVSRTMLPCAS